MIKQAKISDMITERLESMILDGTLIAGEKLLPERLLAEKFQVSRPSLREAIQNLTAKGLIIRKQGGGTFVTKSLNKTMTDPLMDLVASRPETQFDLLEFRHALEGMAAYYAALRGQSKDFALLQDALQALSNPALQQDKEAEAAALSEFYIAMSKAAHNNVLMHVMRTMQPMLVENIRGNLAMLRSGADVEQTIQQQRKEIVDAIVAGDPIQARSASHKHLEFIEQTLLDINQRDATVQRSLRRITAE
ncbi:pyruvate dehydrogenase complex transcriptional repressor PdhR [Glaciecola sp. XM2]|jgi:GntR family transcriptional repressor for pyruvate dehydrogenase complex|uniref:pyruvate dehydrogenase complex transcriptional repressor PdhR n=1 Tax=Glaciecola sp. XM2 TaxID=1914931 RepID=UPI001BDE5344|nr:pyruvate dehydrogenase complex transcriptional repressor PdhR [Glaciecola sp. XM2]MBT1450532.1 pyruvate dehydrogenase complex transcriptional repressor PdhR [Glaciecola sp. XM2]